MVLCLCVLIVFSLCRESCKLILVDEPLPEVVPSQVVIYLDDTSTKHLTLLVIPKSHILLLLLGSEVREPFLLSGHVS
jgi:hypothetical protein